MWNWLHPYAKPERAYWLCRRLAPWFFWPSLFVLLVGTVWGLAFAPPDYQQGNSFRIIYIHVPTAMLGMGVPGHGYRRFCRYCLAAAPG